MNLKRIPEEQFDNLLAFKKMSNIPISMETVRKLTYNGIPVSTISVVTILKYLNFSPDEIKEVLLNQRELYIVPDVQEQRLALDMAELIGDNKMKLSDRDRAVIELCRRLEKGSLQAYNFCIEHLVMTLKANNLDDLIPLTMKMKRGGGKRRGNL
ncbi:MAG: hypothetical protein PHV97_05355 [Candidatus Omnitrophica bacterium]|nr:hypothetical protein [Candidatus Omnitrophota bacterium]